MSDPLAGFLPVVQLYNNASTLIESIVLRLAVCSSRKQSSLIREQLRKESNEIGFDKNAYMINELLYEFRLAKGKVDLTFEGVVVNNWVAKIISKKGEDAGLDFLNTLKANREKRKR